MKDDRGVGEYTLGAPDRLMRLLGFNYSFGINHLAAVVRRQFVERRWLD